MSDLRGRLAEHAVYRPFYASLVGISRSISVYQGVRFTWRGTENVPRTGGVVLAVNHIGYMDPVYAGLAARKAHRRVRYMGKVEVLDHPVTAVLARGAHFIPVDREAGAESFEAAVAALRGGDCVGVFPEATISRSFELKEFKSGAARMAIEANVPLVPVVLWGAQRVATKGQPKGVGRTRPHVWVEVCEPIAPHGPAEELTAELKRRMGERLLRIQDEYGPHPQGAYWVPKRLGGGAPSLQEANELDEREKAARRARKLGTGE